jgi:hypothetical protein
MRSQEQENNYTGAVFFGFNYITEIEATDFIYLQIRGLISWEENF